MIALGAAIEPAPFPFPAPEQGQGCRYVVEHAPYGDPNAPPTQTTIAVTRHPDEAASEHHAQMAEGYLAWWARWHAESPGHWQLRRACAGREDAIVDAWTVGGPPSALPYIAAALAAAAGIGVGWLLRGRRP